MHTIDRGNTTDTSHVDLWHDCASVGVLCPSNQKFEHIHLSKANNLLSQLCRAIMAQLHNASQTQLTDELSYSYLSFVVDQIQKALLGLWEDVGLIVYLSYVGRSGYIPLPRPAREVCRLDSARFG